jgi:beta-lactamase superfamily II metal-dependent hydrolase
MIEIDFLPVGDGGDSGDAIAMRFTRPDTGGIAHVIVDAGFQDDGEALVEHVKTYYKTSQVDLAILTHPDGDHIGGMGNVIRGLNVSELWLHQIGAHGGSSLPAAKAVEDLINVATENGTVVREAWAGAQRFGGALTILGPDKPYYEALVAEQLAEQDKRVAPPVSKSLLEAARGLFDRITDALDIEIPFAAKDVTARNNSSMICLIRHNGSHHLLTADAGVPALDRAWTYAESVEIAAVPVVVQIPHHGSRRNASSAWLNRLIGEPGQAECRAAFVSVVPNSDKHPSGKVVNAYKRRGCKVIPTAGSGKYHFQGILLRAGWEPAEGLSPMVEEED